MYPFTKVIPHAVDHWKDGLTCPYCGVGADGVVYEGNTYVACHECGVYWDFGFDIKAIPLEKLSLVFRSLVGYARLVVALPWCKDD